MKTRPNPTVRQALACPHRCPLATDLKVVQENHPPTDRHAPVQRSYRAVYKEFWKDLLERRGVLVKDRVMRELSDYAQLLDMVPKVYCDITGGRISKPFTDTDSVVSEAEAVNLDALQDAKDELKDALKGRKTMKVKEFLDLLDAYI